ncbi:MAG: sensor histidine kinase [Clostridiales bacterium]|nr:sensor histidine kinase [Clostridiales bacterium]
MKTKLFQKAGIRSIIFIYFTVMALAASICMGLSFYARMSSQLEASRQEESQILISQLNRSVDSYLRTIMKLSDTLYYSVIKNVDLSTDSVNRELMLLYDNNKDSVESIALLSGEGEILEAVPAARLNPRADAAKESWFQESLEQTENLHFSQPHVQHIFDSGDSQYRWVITVSRAVEITQGTSTSQGVLLVDIRYDSLKQIFNGVSLGQGGYVYLTDRQGNLICHPDAQLIDSGLKKENGAGDAALRDGSHEEEFEGQKRVVSVKTVGYTGWKLIGVMPEGGTSLNFIKTQILMVFIAGLILYILMIINSYISNRITGPIRKLEKSVNEIEEGNLETVVYTGGSYEVYHLGTSIQKMARQIRQLMDDIVAEHESKRKSEFDTLQSQINPHFLYNTLDIIVWMIENEKQDEAVKAVTALARFFRISLSRGKSIILARDELEHVRNYLMIQHMRYKNRFTYRIEAEEEVLGFASLKLILQPMVENAIYHGMEFMDGDGEILIRAWKEEGWLFFEVRDNGLGMTEEQVENLFSDTGHVSSRRGSGIGVKNVNQRIKLYFGKEYGLTIQSEPDEGTAVRICLPAVDYEVFMREEAAHE